MASKLSKSYNRPPVWQMIREALEELGGKASHRDIIAHIQRKYGAVNRSTVQCQITICTVNSPSRIYFPENHRPRKCNTRYDFLYSTHRGEVVFFNPAVHGEWGISHTNGRLAVVKYNGASEFAVLPRRQTKECVGSEPEDEVFCPACKKSVMIRDERAGRCPLCDSKISDLFEEELRDFLFHEWKIKLRPLTVRIREAEKSFDLVSDDMNYVGDAKFYKSLDVPAAKWSTIAEYVWLLQFTSAKNKFLVFGRDRGVPQRWLNRYRSLLGGVKFYFFDHQARRLENLT